LPGYRVNPEPPSSVYEAVARATLEVVDEGIEQGIRIAFDVLPNTTDGAIPIPYLVSLLGPWVRDAGSPARLAELLAAPDYEAEIREKITGGEWYMLNPHLNPSWAENISILQCEDSRLEGRSVADIAREAGCDPLDAFFDLVRDHPLARVLACMFDDREAAMRVFLDHPRCSVCTDTFIVDDQWESQYPPYFLAHPNTFGAFPRYLSGYMKPTMEESLTRITSRPARALGLSDRGVLSEGAFADVVVFDAENITEKADFLEPRQYPEGIRWVIVNGKVVVEGGVQRDVRPGRVLRHPGA
ncbi:MAG: amidohydrolase family protein, partial [Bacillota bacterium]